MLLSSPDPRPLAPARGRHRAPREHAGARRAGLVGALATLTAGGVGVAWWQHDQQDQVEAPVTAAPVVAAAGGGVHARLASRPVSVRADRSARPAVKVATWAKPLDSYRLTSRFGPRWGRIHHGLDFACPVGTPVKTVSSGTVTDVRTNARVYGAFVDVRHRDGSLTRYAHLSRLTVAKGATVATGQVIGLSGNAGISTGPHLHLELHPKGDPRLTDAADPMVELRRRGVRL